MATTPFTRPRPRISRSGLSGSGAPVAVRAASSSVGGFMVRTRPDVNPTFDDTETFYLDVKSGVIRANIGDIGGFLNAGGAADSPLKNIKLLADGEKIKLKGSLRKLISLPVEMLGSVSAASDNRIQVRVEKLSVLKIPVTGLLRGLHITASDLVGSKVIPGIAVFGNDMIVFTPGLRI